MEGSYAEFMASRAAISVDEYLHTSFLDLDREYRDGELVERTMPDSLHGRTQALLGAFLIVAGRTLRLWACTETRMKLRSRVFLIPDIAVFASPQPLLPDTPPLIAIEILSPDDRLQAVREKLQEYHAWGVKHAWLVDPHGRRFYTCDDGLKEVATLTVPELGLEVRPEDAFE